MYFYHGNFLCKNKVSLMTFLPNVAFSGHSNTLHYYARFFFSLCKGSHLPKQRFILKV